MPSDHACPYFAHAFLIDSAPRTWLGPPATVAANPAVAQSRAPPHPIAPKLGAMGPRLPVPRRLVAVRAKCQVPSAKCCLTSPAPVTLGTASPLTLGLQEGEVFPHPLSVSRRNPNEHSPSRQEGRPGRPRHRRLH